MISQSQRRKWRKQRAGKSTHRNHYGKRMRYPDPREVKLDLPDFSKFESEAVRVLGGEETSPASEAKLEHFRELVEENPLRIILAWAEAFGEVPAPDLQVLLKRIGEHVKKQQEEEAQ